MEYSEPNERLKDQSKCADLRAELKMCLLKTDCCKIVSNSFFIKFFCIHSEFQYSIGITHMNSTKYNTSLYIAVQVLFFIFMSYIFRSYINTLITYTGVLCYNHMFSLLHDFCSTSSHLDSVYCSAMNLYLSSVICYDIVFLNAKDPL